MALTALRASACRPSSSSLSTAPATSTCASAAGGPANTPTNPSVTIGARNVDAAWARALRAAATSMSSLTFRVRWGTCRPCPAVASDGIPASSMAAHSRRTLASPSSSKYNATANGTNGSPVFPLPQQLQVRARSRFCDRTPVGTGHQLRVLGEDASRIPRRRHLPVLPPAGQLALVDVDVDGVGVDVDHDAITVAHERDGAAVDRLRRHVADAEAVGAAREAPVGEQRTVTTAAGPLHGAGDG